MKKRIITTENLEEDIKLYTDLINQGFAESMETIFTTLYNSTYFGVMQ